MNNDNLDDIIKTHSEQQLMPSDVCRIDEIESHITLKSELFELGFRFPRLLRYYQSVFKTVKGCDVVDLNVSVGQSLGFNVMKCDLNDSVPDLSHSSVVVAYHVLEHVSRPDVTISRIEESMSDGSLFHVEVPIEPGIPRLRYAHMFPFERNDLTRMCEIAGFTILKTCHNPYPGGPDIERCLVVKNKR